MAFFRPVQDVVARFKMTTMNRNTADFDKAAPLYDDTFTESHIGQLQRKKVYFWLDQIDFFRTTQSVFELNCGTGYDADYFHSRGITVIATDGSPQMIAVAQSKRNIAIEFFPMDFAEIETCYKDSDAIFSNFGGLNCLDSQDLNALLTKTSQLQKSGDRWIGVMMPKFCLMESLYFIAKFQFKKAVRRNTNHAVSVNVDGTTVSTYYHSPKEVKKMLATNYHIEKTKPVALFLPPSYLEPFFKKRPKMLNFLSRLETIYGPLSFLSGLSDHYILIARKK